MACVGCINWTLASSLGSPPPAVWGVWGGGDGQLDTLIRQECMGPSQSHQLCSATQHSESMVSVLGSSDAHTGKKQLISSSQSGSTYIYAHTGNKQLSAPLSVRIWWHTHTQATNSLLASLSVGSSDAHTSNKPVSSAHIALRASPTSQIEDSLFSLICAVEAFDVVTRQFLHM